jgi:type I restriction-modification system DNA methylase subunit
MRNGEEIKDRLAVMNLALRGIEADFGPEHADTFRRDLHPDLRADYVLANPPFNDSDWFRKDDDVRWQYGVPPRGNANFAWVQHFIHHLAPHGMAGFVLARFWLWMKHRCRRANSREETGDASCAFNEECDRRYLAPLRCLDSGVSAIQPNL